MSAREAAQIVAEAESREGSAYGPPELERRWQRRVLQAEVLLAAFQINDHSSLL